MLSVEGAVARLRRASLPAELAARRAAIEVVPGPTGPVEHPDAVQRYRPRARALRGPAGRPRSARVLQLTDAAGATSTTHELVTLDPAAAADRILAALAEWGYLDAGRRPDPATRRHARHVSSSPAPPAIIEPGITRRRVGVRRSTPNSGTSGFGHIGMIAGS